MRIIVEKNYDEMSRHAAQLIASQIIMNPSSVLGLATGSTPIGLYKKLVQMYEQNDLNFSEVTSFNLDEYVGLGQDHEQSYSAFMKLNLFDHINIAKENTHIPSGHSNRIKEECLAYESLIENSKGIDVQILGIGHNGHIGFNEPGANFEAKTHLVELDDRTIQANARFFESKEDVPTQAISMGIKTIMKAKCIVLLASGVEKAQVVYDMIHGPISPKLPASVLQLHPKLIVVLDKEAASKLQTLEGIA